jgi:hypothetical protein
MCGIYPPKDHAVFEVVETLRRCTIWSVKANLDPGLLTLFRHVPALISSIAIRLDVNLHAILDACRNGKWMPVETRQ